MNKDELIEAMRGAVNPLQPVCGIVPEPILKACAEAALTLMSREWVDGIIKSIEVSIRANNSSYTGGNIVLTQDDIKQVLSDIRNVLPTPPKDK